MAMLSREEAYEKWLNRDKDDEVSDLVDAIYDSFEEQSENRQEYDLKIKSDERGYLGGMAWLGRCKPNTTYIVFVEEVKEKRYKKNLKSF